MKGTLRHRLERLESMSAPVDDNRSREELARRLDALAERMKASGMAPEDPAPALAFLAEHYGVRL